MIAFESLLVVAGMACFSYALSILCNKDNNEDRLGKTKGANRKPFALRKQLPASTDKPKG